MFKSVLIETLRALSRQEMKELGLFIQSPFFNTNQSVMGLFEQLRKLYPLFEENKLNKKLLFENAFGKIKYNDSFMRMTSFRLLELAKEFLIYKNLQRNNFVKETLLIDELNFRELNNLMLKSISEADKKMKKLKAKHPDVYFAEYRLEYFKNDIKARDTKMITYKDSLNKDLMMEQKSLNTYFFISSLKFFQYYLNQKTFVVNAGGYPDFVNEIIEYLGLHKEYLTNPVLNAYYLLVLMLISKDDKYFFGLKKILFEDNGSLSHVEKYNLVTVLRNYGSQKYLEGSKEFNENVFDILKFSVGKGLITSTPEGKYINENRFTHIAGMGLRAKDYEWVKGFLKKYLDKIEPDKRNYIFAFNSAWLEFEKGNFTDALEYLGKSGQIKNVFYKAEIKHLTLMIYYELKWFIPAADLLDAFRHFIKTDKLLPEMYVNQNNAFANFYGRLLKLNNQTGNNSFEIAKLVKELRATSQKWLLKKAMELKEKTISS